MPSRPVLREMRESDVPAVLAVQEPAAVAGDEVLHFGTALDTWGSGLATTSWSSGYARTASVRPRLFVYAGNARGRRFWHKHGWRPKGEVTSGSFPPYAELLAYELRAARR